MFAVCCGDVITIGDFPADFKTSKVNRESRIHLTTVEIKVVKSDTTHVTVTFFPVPIVIVSQKLHTIYTVSIHGRSNRYKSKTSFVESLIDYVASRHFHFLVIT